MERLALARIAIDRSITTRCRSPGRFVMSGGWVVKCSVPDCGEPAAYKVAAPSSDGRFAELKTYGLACRDHIRDVLRSAEARWLDYEPVRGEVVQDVGIYIYEPGKFDRELQRDWDLEETLRS